MRAGVFATIAVLHFSMFAQQDPQVSQYIFNQLSFNPAFAGSGARMNFVGTFRNQWSGFEGAPKSYLVNIDSKTDKINSGAGLSFIRDEIGFERSL
jgi:type IX secretion system PorP/SprF family membrane protein